uniref:peptidylprolyl isomerase n=1 Tax=Amblyomma triste TaxID=251400 RepID=A0A023GIS6_AMBTT
MVMLEHGKAEFLLCTLDQAHSRQVPLDLNFVEGEEVTFFLNGKGTVHLTGYLTDGLQDDEESSDDEVSLPDEEEEEQENDLSMAQKSPKRTKKPKQALLQALNGDDSEDESDTDFDVDQVEDETEEDEEDADDDDADEDASEEEEEEEPLSLVQQKRPPQKRPADKAFGNASPSGEKRTSLVPSTSPEESSAKKKRKKNKKQRSETPTADTENSQAQPSPQNAHMQGNKGVTAKLPGGVISTDLRVGSGPVAKPGRVMHVYYTGKLSNNKVFDSCTSGKAFSFRLGKHEVIKGWDTGIQGMKVGGKRRLIIPPSLAYGNTRMGSIPPNSTLHFDVELKAVS